MHLSFEYFPPKDHNHLSKLIQTTHELNKTNPEFFSVTYGAGGSTQERTLTTVKALQQQFDIAIAPHMTCIGTSRKQVTELLEQYRELGIDRLVVLRGDLPDNTKFASDDFQYAYQLVEFIANKFDFHFKLEVAAYPETHPESPSAQQHLAHLKQKIDAGAHRVITQYFYNTDAYFYLCDDLKSAGSIIDVIPGIMPITNYTQLIHFSERCGAEVPRWLQRRLADYQDDLVSLREFGTEFTIRLCERLLAGGAPGLHFYTLNRLNPSIDVVKALGATP